MSIQQFMIINYRRIYDRNKGDRNEKEVNNN